jgi:hypothetical protein
MIPTLFGRWQTRLLLLTTVGSFVSLLFFLIDPNPIFFIILSYVTILGLGWDILYNHRNYSGLKDR